MAVQHMWGSVCEAFALEICQQVMIWVQKGCSKSSIKAIVFTNAGGIFHYNHEALVHVKHSFHCLLISV